jgi:hypothetical protein
MAGNKVLLVEGIDDEHVFKHLFYNRGLPNINEIISHGGVNHLLEEFPIRIKERESAEGDIVGVVIDADTDLHARWQSLRDKLINVGYTEVPTNPMPDGTIIEPPAETLLPIVGIWIMPDNQTTGILEDFLQLLVPVDSLLFDHVKSSVASIPKDEVRFRETARPKAIIHTWLAWQDEPGKPLGTSITARYLDPGVTQVDVLVSWLNRLYFS